MIEEDTKKRMRELKTEPGVRVKNHAPLPVYVQSVRDPNQINDIEIGWFLVYKEGEPKKIKRISEEVIDLEIKIREIENPEEGHSTRSISNINQQLNEEDK